MAPEYEEDEDIQEAAPAVYERKAYMYQGVGCCYTGCDLDNIMLCSKADVEICCLSHEHCLAANHPDLGIGLLPPKSSSSNGECCKLGCFCCTVGCQQPAVLCKGVTQQWCMTQVMSFPFHKDYVAEPVCAFCFFQCQPNNGCMLAYPEAPAMLPILDCTTPISEVITR